MNNLNIGHDFAQSFKALEEGLRDFIEVWQDAEAQVEVRLREGVTMEDLQPLDEALTRARKAGVDNEVVSEARGSLEIIWQLAVLHDKRRIRILGGDPDKITPDPSD